MKRIKGFLLGKVPKTAFLSLKFEDEDLLHELGRLMQYLLSQGKEISSESIWIHSRNKKLVQTYMVLSDESDARELWLNKSQRGMMDSSIS